MITNIDISDVFYERRCGSKLTCSLIVHIMFGTTIGRFLFTGKGITIDEARYDAFLNILEGNAHYNFEFGDSLMFDFSDSIPSDYSNIVSYSYDDCKVRIDPYVMEHKDFDFKNIKLNFQ